MSNEPKLSERLRVIQNLVGGAFKIAHDGIDEESVEAAWDARKADGILITCIAQCEALEAREPNVMPTYLSRDYEALYDLLLAGGEAFGLVDYKWDDNSNPSRDVVRIRRREAWRIDVGARGIGYNDFGPYLKEKWANNELNAFANDCRRMNLEWVAPLDRSRMVEAMVMEVIRSGDHMDRVLNESPRGLKEIEASAIWSRVSKDLLSALAKK